MIILDTDIYSLLQADRDPVVAKLKPRVLSGIEVPCVTIITYEEQMRGWLSYLAKTDDEPKRILAYTRLKEMLDDFADLGVIPYDQESSFHYLRLRQAKVRIGTMDLKIAAIALAHSATLVTRNVRDFEKIAGLKFEDWTNA